MKRASDYKLITNHSLLEFNRDVSEHLRRGWTLRGNTRITKTNLVLSPFIYSQELIWES